MCVHASSVKQFRILGLMFGNLYRVVKLLPSSIIELMLPEPVQSFRCNTIQIVKISYLNTIIL